MLIMQYPNSHIEVIDNTTPQFADFRVSDGGDIEIEQQFFGPGAPIYYTKKKDVLIISDSLRKLKEASGHKYEINLEMLPHFFYNGFIYGEHTLVKGVYKIPLCKRVTAGRNGVNIEPWNDGRKEAEKQADRKRASDYTDYKELEKSYKRHLRDVIREMCSGEISRPITMALSGGYDSNCILHFVKELFPEKGVLAICVGGINGVDERETAREITGYYPGVRFIDSVVSPETLDFLDDIVFRLEGSVYERGIFLQYELARKLNQEGTDKILCGECADQVFHEKSYTRHDEGFLYDYSNTPREMAAYVVLPKSYILLKSFGIQGLYPFLDRRIVSIGKATAEINGSEKKFHKRFCEHNISSEIYPKLNKKGGSTSLTAMFSSVSKVEQMVTGAKFYDPCFRITGKYGRDEALIDYLLSLKFIESFERQFCD